MTNTKLYVGNLSFELDETAIRSAFQACGNVTDVYLAMDRETRRPRGFAFVTMSSPEEAKAAIAQFDGKDLGGRAVTVNEARPKEAGAGRRF